MTLDVVWNGSSRRYGSGRGTLLSARSQHRNPLLLAETLDITDVSWACQRAKERRARRRAEDAEAQVVRRGLRRCGCGCGLLLMVPDATRRGAQQVFHPGHLARDTFVGTSGSGRRSA